jgi:uncharacterized membrane protein YqiK
MSGNSEVILGLLIPVATVVFIILCVLAFLWRNRELLEQEQALERASTFLLDVDQPARQPDPYRRQDGSP